MDLSAKDAKDAKILRGSMHPDGLVITVIASDKNDNSVGHQISPPNTQASIAKDTQTRSHNSR